MAEQISTDRIQLGRVQDPTVNEDLGDVAIEAPAAAAISDDKRTTGIVITALTPWLAPLIDISQALAELEIANRCEPELGMAQ